MIASARTHVHVTSCCIGRNQPSSPHRQPEETPRTLAGQPRPPTGRADRLRQGAGDAEGHGVPKIATSLRQWSGAHPRGGGFPNETGGHRDTLHHLDSHNDISRVYDN